MVLNTGPLDLDSSTLTTRPLVHKYPDQLRIFPKPGCVSPVRKNFRFSEKQKKILYKLFMDGEVSGNNMNPEQVHLELRKVLTPSEYVSSQQICSLFSR